MPNPQIDQVNVNGTSYDIVDNTSGYLKSISAADVSSALGYTPYDSSNPSGYITGMFIAAYGKTTYADVLAAYQANKVVYCRASSNASNPGTGNQLRMAFLAYVNNEATPTEFEFQYYRSVATHSNTQQGDQVYVYKLKSASGWEFSVREAYTKIVNGSGLSGSYSSGALTLNHSNSVTAQTTQAVYPIKIDAQGHISGYGTAVTIPSKVSDLSNDSGFITLADLPVWDGSTS